MLLCRIEQGEIKDYTQTEKIDRVRRVHAQRHTYTGHDTVKNASKRNNSNPWCASIITQELAHNKTHTKQKGVTYRHMCSFHHTEMHYRNKQKTKKD